MNPLLKQILAGVIAPAKENLIDQAAQANQTAGTTDPEQVQKNVDFQAEIDRLKELQGDNSDGGTSTDPVEGNLDGSGGNDDGTQPNPDNAGGGDTGGGDGGEGGEGANGGDNGDPDPDNTDPEQKSGEDEEDPGNGDVSDEPEASADGEEDDQEPDEDTDPPTEDAEIAQEALRVAAEALLAIENAHEIGVVKPRHIALFDLAIESQYLSLGITTRPGVSLESDLPEGSAGKIKYAAGKVAEFLRQILAKMKEYYVKVMRWIRDFFQGYREANGVFAKNTDGLLKRINYLKGKERDQAEIDQLAEKKAISGRRLSTDGSVPTLASIASGIDAMQSVGKGIRYSVTEEEAYGPLVDLVSDFDVNDMEGAISRTSNGIRPETMFRIAGTSSVFENSDLYRNSSIKESSFTNMVDFSIRNLFGLSSYVWTLAGGDVKGIDSVVHFNHGYKFSIHTERRDVMVPLLTNLDDCEKAMQLVAPLLKELQVMGDMTKVMEAVEATIIKNQTVMKNLVDVIDMDETSKMKVLMAYSTGQSAYTNLFVKSVTAHMQNLDAVVKTIHTWVAQSLNIIAPEKAQAA